jgi:hypothetical protein
MDDVAISCGCYLNNKGESLYEIAAQQLLLATLGQIAALLVLLTRFSP